MHREDERQAGERRDRGEILGEVEAQIGLVTSLVTFDNVPMNKV